MPGSSAAFRSQWNISKSTLGIETVVTQATLASMALVLDDRHVPSLTQLSEQADNLRPSSWWHSLFTYQLPLKRVHISANENISWCFHRLWEHPLAWWGAMAWWGTQSKEGSGKTPFWTSISSCLHSTDERRQTGPASMCHLPPSVSGGSQSMLFFFFFNNSSRKSISTLPHLDSST